ncbi:zinc finger protein 62 homolog [Bradysia coprophila]|uniref:zinc finger protein 62 homolog n=1 Tax=Bradysia coprophila TaxID=38358 RepID=UPI00187DB5E4|nr:zinc finger protein 62 homolog [Bradysia coprophila]
MVNCFLCLVTLSKKCATFNILKCHGAHSKTKYGDLIGKLLDDQKLVITISEENYICETCNTLIDAFDRHFYEENVIKQILSRQVGFSYLKNRGVSLSIDSEALATFDKRLDTYQCKQCTSFKTNKIEFVAAHFKAHQCKLNDTRPVVKHEIDDDDQEMPIEEILLNPSCKYEDLDDDNEVGASSKELYMTVGENSETSFDGNENRERKRRRVHRSTNDSVTNYTASTTQASLPKHFKDIIKVTQMRNAQTSVCQVDNLFVIEVPKIETTGFHFSCKICLRKFLHPSKLASHLLTHKDIKYSCKHCSFAISNYEDSMVEHMKWNHPGMDRHDFLMDISDELANTCFRCGFHNNTIGLACSHQIAITRGTQKFECKVCHGDFYGFENLRNHMHTDHQLCKFCNKIIAHRFTQHKCLLSEKNKSTNNQVYYKITAYDWFQGKREDVKDVEQVEQTVRLRNGTMQDNYVKKPSIDYADVDAPVPVIMKLITSKVKPAKVQKVNLKIRRRGAEVLDDNQDRINTFFDNLFPMNRGESSSDTDVNRLFSIDNRSQTGTGAVRCKICLEEFVSALKLKAHLIIHKNLMYKCQYCPLELANNEYGMRFHMRTAHEEQSKFDYGIEDSGEIVNVCAICSDNVEPGVACNHENAFTNGVDIKTCRNCPKTFYGDPALREHCHAEHGTCKICQRMFPRPATLARHYVNHQNKEYFKCHTCQKVLSSVGTYKNHLSEHTGNYRFSCEVCDKKFNVKLSYEEHLRSHDMKKKYICHICGQGFIHSATFLIHKIWHQNPMPFECIVCKKKYRTRSALRMHDRKVHLKTPTTFCPECNKGLYSPADLKNHMVVHTGIYNYPCDLCPSKFFRSDRLRRHRKNCHGIEVPKKQIEYKVAIRPLLGEMQ